VTKLFFALHYYFNYITIITIIFLIIAIIANQNYAKWVGIHCKKQADRIIIALLSCHT
jgi:hypothetical protein